MKKKFIQGVKDGIPIFLGYLSVSFGFGILAANLGLSAFEAFMISATNLTSAGQVAGVGIIAAGGTLVEMALTQFIINLRYALMGLSLSQKLDPAFSTIHRLVASFGITDEIFAVSYSQKEPVKPSYMYGLILISFLGWTLGTVLGAAAGEILPQALTNAMGIMLYGMFLAIIIPPARESCGIMMVILFASVVSLVFHFCIPTVSGGFSIILSALAASIVCAIIFPVQEEN